MSEKHTPLPWKFDEIDTIFSLPSDCEICTIRAIKDANYTHGGKYNTLAMKANANLIVTAVNNYARMRSALSGVVLELRGIQALIKGIYGIEIESEDMILSLRKAEAILAETEGL